MKFINILIIAAFFSCYAVIASQEQGTKDGQLVELAGPADSNSQRQVQTEKTSFGQAAQTAQQKLEQSVAGLNELRERVAEEKIPLSQKLNDLESELTKVRLEYQQTTRLLDSRTLDLSNLRSEIKSRNEESAYLSNLLGEYIRNFESRLHIAEIQRYRGPLETAKLAPENSNLSEQEIYQAQTNLLLVSLERLNDALNGTRFDGTATDSTGSIHHGTFVLIGPSALFQSDDGINIGTAEQKLGSLEPTVIAFDNPADAAAASKVISGLTGPFPFDPTLGNAHKIEETKETFLQHIKKGGPVMYPIFVLAGAALIVAVYKWVFLTFMRKPSQRKIRAMLNAVAEHDENAARQKAKAIGGPVGKMLYAGVEHLKEPRDLIEEVMYEKMLETRLRLQRFLPFIAISAASAPLLGLLGTVTGIINTFKLITVFGSGDVKTLSGGISEALITTEYGLIVAIPSLLLHAFLSRKARGVVNEMEKAAVALMNQVSKTPYSNNNKNDASSLLAGLTAEQVQVLLHNLTNRGQSNDLPPARRYAEDSAGSIMNSRMVSVYKNDTVAEAISKVRSAGIGEDFEGVYVVDEHGKYVGCVSLRHLLTRPENLNVGSLSDGKAVFVHSDTHRDEVKSLLKKHDLVSMPVLDHDNRLIGQVSWNGNGDGEWMR